MSSGPNIPRRDRKVAPIEIHFDAEVAERLRAERGKAMSRIVNQVMRQHYGLPEPTAEPRREEET